MLVKYIHLLYRNREKFIWIASEFADPQVFTGEGNLVSPQFPAAFSSQYADSEFGDFMESDCKIVMKSILGDVGIWNWKSDEFVEVPDKSRSYCSSGERIVDHHKGGCNQLMGSAS